MDDESAAIIDNLLKHSPSTSTQHKIISTSFNLIGIMFTLNQSLEIDRPFPKCDNNRYTPPSLATIIDEVLKFFSSFYWYTKNINQEYQESIQQFS